VGTHQAEYGVYLYNYGRIPQNAIVYRVFRGKKLWEETLGRDSRCWLVQWFGFPPYIESVLDRWYEKAAVFTGRYGEVSVYRKREDIPDKDREAYRALQETPRASQGSG